MAATALPQPLWLFPTLNTTTMRKELPEEKLASIRRAFTTFDSGTKGYLDREDLRMAMTALLVLCKNLSPCKLILCKIRAIALQSLNFILLPQKMGKRAPVV